MRGKFKVVNYKVGDVLNFKEINELKNYLFDKAWEQSKGDPKIYNKLKNLYLSDVKFVFTEGIKKEILDSMKPEKYYVAQYNSRLKNK